MLRVFGGLVFCFVLIASSLAGTSPALAQTAPPATATPASDTDVVEMEPITDPWVDPEDALGDAFFASLESDPVASEIEGSTQLQPDEFKLLPADVALTDFYAELYYLTPTLPDGGEFSVGFCFWVDADGGCYDVVIQVDSAGNAIVGSGFMPAVGQGEYRAMTLTTTLAEPQMDPTPGAENSLSLMVYEGYAILSGNNFDAIALIALPDDALAGKVKAQIGFVDYGVPAGTGPLEVTITELDVWDLSSGMTPAFDSPDEGPPTVVPAKPLGNEGIEPSR